MCSLSAFAALFNVSADLSRYCERRSGRAGSKVHEAKIPHAPEALWPLPIPFWKLAVGDDNGVADSHLKRGINVLVIVLNWLQLSSKAA